MATQQSKPTTSGTAPAILLGTGVVLLAVSQPLGAVVVIAGVVLLGVRIAHALMR